MLWTTLLLGCAAIAGVGPLERTDEGRPRVYVGTYTDGDSRGIYLLDLDPASGELTERGLVGETDNPSFLALTPDGRHLYAVNEAVDGSEGGVSAFAVEPERGTLRALNRQASRGTAPCHLTVDRRGENVLVANYGSGTLAVLPIGEGGRLEPASATIQHEGKGPDPGRQEGPHAHSINLDAANRFAVAADLGIDKLLIYRYDPSGGTLTPNEPASSAVAPGSGPRHFAFHPDGRHAYVINEMKSTVTAFDYDPEHGALSPIQTLSTLPDDYDGPNGTAEVQVHPSGKFLYGSNRGHDSIAIFSIDPESGRLTAVGHQATGGKTPRNFGIDPSGTFLLAANQGSGNVVVFRIDGASGRLQPTGHEARVPKPVCVKFAP